MARKRRPRTSVASRTDNPPRSATPKTCDCEFKQRRASSTNVDILVALSFAAAISMLLIAAAKARRSASRLLKLSIACGNSSSSTRFFTRRAICSRKLNCSNSPISARRNSAGAATRGNACTRAANAWITSAVQASAAGCTSCDGRLFFSTSFSSIFAVSAFSI